MSNMSHILDRIERKKVDYQHYNFSERENNALKTFFDLAQEFDSLDAFYLLSVAIPKSFFDLDARLYIISPKTNGLCLAATTVKNDMPINAPAPAHIQPGEHPIITGDHVLALTIRGKRSLIDQLPFKTSGNVMGVLEIFPFTGMTVSEEFFFEKYANRIGYNVHNRFISQKNVEHLKFIRSLVADIEHNIIVPNIIYKLYLRNLKNKINKNIVIEQMLKDDLKEEKYDIAHIAGVLAELSDVNRSLVGEYENIEKHYRNMSLFLETLLRRSHFDQGRLTLRTKPCNINKEIVQPQLERYLDRFQEMEIEINDRFSGIPNEDVISVVDVGLMSQVYANLFSNALKYTQEAVTQTGETKKYMSYGRELIPNFFGEGRDGVKYNVFSTGPHIPAEERSKIFEDEYRGSNTELKPGTGHGLSFLKNVIEIHGGIVGYEPTHNGNNFYFILPKSVKQNSR
ncbi:MAG TPA: ATP-binding protein [Dissulfurispiraceae bacterium]|nr:ATP-binding protein [Dissulfurispiraceae bacterium]